MGVIYKLKDEVVEFIVSKRQTNPLFSCRELAEAVVEKFGLNLSKSSVHDVLKQSGISTPRGRKPKDKFKIPQEKKRQIQESLLQVKLLPDPVENLSSVIASPNGEAISSAPSAHQNDKKEKTSVIPNDHAIILSSEVTKDLMVINNSVPDESVAPKEEEIPIEKTDLESSSEYDGAGRIFFKAVYWDLGIFSQQGQSEFPLLKEKDWVYYLTYCKGVKVYLENDQSFFIDLPIPLERCIREVADGLINNIRPMIVHKVSDEALFKSSMNAQDGYNIKKVSIVDVNDHDIVDFNNIVERDKQYIIVNRMFMENSEKDMRNRAMAMFFSQSSENIELIDDLMNLKGFNSQVKDKIIINTFIPDSYGNKVILQEAAERLNGMYLRDEQDRLVKINIKLT